MKFTVERGALERMVEQLKVERGITGPRQRMMRLSACSARVFVEANGVAAGIEALVLEDGGCNVPRMKFLKVLRTYHPKQNVTVAADASGLPGMTVAQAGVWQLHHRVRGVGIDAFAELFQDFDGVVQFSSSGCEHKSEVKTA